MKNPDAYLMPPKLIRKYGTRNPFLLAEEIGRASCRERV